MAWPAQVLEKADPLHQTLAQSIYETIDKHSGGNWVEARLEIVESAEGRYYASLYFLKPDGNAGEAPTAGDIDSAITQLWNLRAMLEDADRFTGLRIAISQQGECSIDYRYKNAGIEVDEEQARALLTLYHKHVCMGFDRQMRMADWLDKNDIGDGWNYTTSQAQLTMGSETKAVQMEAHITGSYASPDNSWLWAWDNPSMQLTAANKQLKDKVQALGKAQSIAAFSQTGKVAMAGVISELAEFTPDMFSMILVGELGYDAYYKIPFQHGAATALITDKRLKFTEEQPLTCIASRFPQVLQAMPIFDHKAALVAYANAYGVTVQDAGSNVELSAKSGGNLAAEFDEVNRLTKLSGSVN